MKSFERYKRLIKLGFSSMSAAMLIIMYGMVWINYYNKIILAPFYRKGNWMMIFIYGVLLVFFMKMYGGFKVGFLKKGNLIYSQILAVVFTNTITYFQIAVQDKKFTTPLPLLLLLMADAILISFWTVFFQWFYCKIFPPRKMLLISGEHSDYHLMEKMNAREDKYEICKIISYRVGMERLIKEMAKYDGVIVGDMPSHERNLIIKYCFGEHIRTYSVPKISDILLRSSVDLNLFDSPLLLFRNQGLTFGQSFLKRAMDIAVGLCGCILASPVMLIIAAAIKLYDGGPVLYSQERITKDGKPFQIYKFRSMIVESEKRGARLASAHDDRITPVGRVIRRLHVDELPQLFNVLAGDMSFVGPRPEREEITKEYEQSIPQFRFRLKMKAGLTGYAQVYGQYNTVPYDKLKLDLTYIENYSLWLDIKLILLTVKILFQKEKSEGVADSQKTALKQQGQ